MNTDFDGHTSYMEPVRKHNSFAQHSLVSSSELNFGDCERVSEMQTSVHVGKWESSEPFGMLLANFILSEALELFRRRGADLKETFIPPSFLILLLEGLQVVSLPGLYTRESSVNTTP